VSLYRRIGKRALDLALGIPIALVAAPIVGVVALKVARELGRPVLFRQTRAGKNGEAFRIYKVRTMTDARDAEGQLLPDEQRLTAFGERLRRTSLDELPQILNVLAGDMSLVGPRPLLVQYTALYSPEQKQRLDVKPGMTGWCQVNGRNAITWPEKFALDTWYVNHMGPLLDLRILVSTALVVLRKQGYAPEGSARAEYFEGNSPQDARAVPVTTFTPGGTK
jgi:lipopolysaccharide/colanic/teichoic acid biosynthesis glycosyltransferase